MTHILEEWSGQSTCPPRTDPFVLLISCVSPGGCQDFDSGLQPRPERIYVDADCEPYKLVYTVSSELGELIP